MGRVLIIEDDLLIALDQQCIVEDHGHVVVGTARTADEAVEVAKTHELDVVIADIRLADGSFGPDAVKRIRQSQDTEVVFVSGNLEPKVKEELSSFDPLALLSKPFNPASLAQALDKLK